MCAFELRCTLNEKITFMSNAYFDWNASNAGDGQPTFVQVTMGMRTTRDLRSVLLEALYAIDRDQQPKNFLCLLFGSGFTRQRLEREVQDLKRVTRPDLRDRIQVVNVRAPSDLSQTQLPGVAEECLKALRQKVMVALMAKPTSSSREAVVGQLLYRWINDMEPVRTSELAELSGASIPTVYAALKTVNPQYLQRDEDRRVFLSGFSADDWQKWLTLSTDSLSVKFVDRSGAPRSPEKLSRELAKLGRSDVAIGGVLGALHYYPSLDITGTPRLDIVVHGSPSTDLSFVAQLDPGLERDDAPQAYANVMVHFVNRPFSLFETRDGVVWADVLECMVHLWNAHLMHQVENLIGHIAPGGLPAPLGD